MHKTLLAAFTALAFSTGAVTAAPAVNKEPQDAATLSTIKSQFGKLMELANRHDIMGLHPHEILRHRGVASKPCLYAGTTDACRVRNGSLQASGSFKTLL